MRIISQDCKFDIPYDEIVVELFDCCVVGRLKEYIGRDIILGSYSTEAKAKKAMYMLRETYQYGKKIPVPKLDESGIDKEDNITLYNTRLINDFFKDGTYVTVKVFQFPKDEDLEE